MYEGDRSRKESLVAHGFRLPLAMDNRPLRFDEFLEQRAAGDLRLGDARAVRDARVLARRRADHPPDRPGRPRGRGAADAPPDRRPAGRDPAARGGRRARAGHDADEEDGRGPDRLPDRVGRARALPALRDRHARAHPDHPRAAARRVRRARRRQPAARGPRPARGLAGGDPRRRQGRLPARPDGADPDDRPRRAQCQRARRHVRRQAHAGDRRRRSTRRTAAARSSSPTTRSTASRRPRS